MIERCPKCGEPARFMKALLWCEVPMIGGTLDLSQLRVVHQRKVEIEGVPTLVCGGGHTWVATGVDFDANAG